MTERRLEIAAGDEGVDDVEILDAVVVGERGVDVTGIVAVVLESSTLEQRNLFGEAERIAGRAASSGTRRQYASIFRAFGDWLARELGRPPAVGDLDADVIAAYARHLATVGGRSGRPAALATQRVYVSMRFHGPRACARLGS